MNNCNCCEKECNYRHAHYFSVTELSEILKTDEKHIITLLLLIDESVITKDLKYNLQAIYCRLVDEFPNLPIIEEINSYFAQFDCAE